jgi:hypothetical protein
MFITQFEDVPDFRFDLGVEHHATVIELDLIGFR